MGDIHTRWPQEELTVAEGETQPCFAWNRTGKGADWKGEWQPTLQDFSRALRRAGILDNKAVDLPGGYAVLPYGVNLLNHFRNMIRVSYQRYGLVEYEYPSLAPLACFKPTEDLFDISGKLLFVNRKDDELSLALSPTGEAAIYSHWRRMVRRREDLPIRMYQQARYYRPVSGGKHGGRGVFQSMESDDIFEFHCAFATGAKKQSELIAYQGLLEGILRSAHVQPVWSTRPPWTNQWQVAHSAVAADVPLPIKATAQISCIYNQGTLFSIPYQVSFREGGKIHYTQHLAGYVSRRLLWAHLLVGMQRDGALFMHPDLSPVHISMLYRGDSPAIAEVDCLGRALRDNGLRVTHTLVAGSKQLKGAYEAESLRGVPLIMIIFGPRDHGDPFRVVLRRADTGEEATAHCRNLLELRGKCTEMVEVIGRAYDRRATNFFRSRLCEVRDARALRDAVMQRYVAVCPLNYGEETVRLVSDWKCGEVLGYCKTSEAKPCALTGQAVDTVAFVSPRI